MTGQDAQIAALIELHRGLERQGPGDPALFREHGAAYGYSFYVLRRDARSVP